MMPDLAVMVSGGPYYRSCEAFVRKGLELILPRIYPEVRRDTNRAPEREFDLWFIHPMDRHEALSRSGQHLFSPLARKRIAVMDLWAPCFDVCFVSWERKGPPHETILDDPRNHLAPVIVPKLDPEWVMSRPRNYVFWHSSDHWEAWDEKTRAIDECLMPRLRDVGVQRVKLAHWDRAGVPPTPKGLEMEPLPLGWRMTDEYYRDLIAGAALYVMSSGNRPHSVKYATGLGVPAVLPEGYTQQEGTLLPQSNLSVVSDRGGYLRRHEAALEDRGLEACIERVRRAVE